jgi:hypothetical protein
MENKYFTPDIENIHAGYECELLIYDKWEPNTIKPYTALKSVVKCIKDKVIRVPYLTKEQIEAEGWIYVKNTNTIDVDICHIFNKNNYMLGWFPLINKIAVLVRDPSKALDKNGILIQYNNTERYTGECKDINTFKKITKLLGI